MQFREQSKRKAVTFSYDDGVTQDIRLVELLNKYGLKSTFNLNSERLGQRKVLFQNGLRIAHYKLHPADVRDVYAGHEIAAHTLTHINLTKVDEAEAVYQVEADRLRLSELAGYEVVGMAYPCGGVNYNHAVAETVRTKTGIRYARTTVCSDSFAPQEDLFTFQPTVYHMNFDHMMELGQTFLESKAEKAQIFYVYGHSYEMDLMPDAWLRLEDFFQLISGKEDIFYGTNAEVLL